MRLPQTPETCCNLTPPEGRANIIVRGGRFYKFDPSNNDTEGPGTNYVAAGCKVEVEGDYYVVKPLI